MSSGEFDYCEPCGWQQVSTPAVTVIGWDFTPVCEFHLNHGVYERRPTSFGPDSSP